jgi:two-component system sensor histidine kinase DegS
MTSNTNKQSSAEVQELRQRVAELEKQLATQNAKLLRLFQSANLGVQECDVLGRIMFVNSAQQKLTGYSADELLGTHVWDRMEPGPQKDALPAYLESLVLNQPVPTPYLCKCIRKNGEKLDIRVDWNYVRDANGQIEGFVNVISDVSEQNRTEEELRKSRATLQACIDCLPFDFFAMDMEWHYFLQNTSSKKLWGDVSGKSPEEVCKNPHDLAIWKDCDRRALAGERVEREIVLESYGSENTFYNVVVPIQNGEEQYGILGVCVDITARKNAEKSLQKARDELEERVALRTQELAQANEALQQRHDELQAIYNGVIDGIHILDLNTMRAIRINSSLCRMIGYSEAEALQLSPEDIHPAEELPKIQEALQSNLKNHKIWSTELPLVRKDGSILYAEVTANQIVYDNRPCLICCFRDTTERRKANEAIKKEQNTLRHLLQSSDHERQLIAYEIHDGLAQYLAGAIMQLEAFQHLKETKPNDAAKAFQTAMAMLHQGHFEARRLIADVRPPVLDESGIIEAITHLIHEESHKKGPKIESHCEVSFNRLTPIVENAIYRIVQEGLTNACRYSKSEKVDVELTQQGDQLRIKIQDWGQGFDPEIVHEDRYGLAGVRERARLLGGNAVIESIVGQGTCINVEIPLMLKI